MSKVIYGANGIRQRDYRVWINFEDMSSGAGELDYITAVDAMGEMAELIDASEYENAKAKLDLLKESMYHVGEMRADSIDLSIEDGDSIEGNEVGKIIVGKVGKFSAELINSTPDILTWLSQRDSKECIIMLEEISSTRLAEYDGAMLEVHEIILIGNVPAMIAGITDNVGFAFNYSEKIVGKNIAISTINVEKTVPTTTHFRKIYDLRYEEPLRGVELQSIGTTPEGRVVRLEWIWEGDREAINSYLIECSTSDFAEIEFSAITDDYPATQADVTLYAGNWKFRIAGLKNNVQKTIYGNVQAVTVK